MRQNACPESLRRGDELLHVLGRVVVLNGVLNGSGVNVHAFRITGRLLTVLNTSTVAEIKRAGDKYKTDLSGASKC